MKLEYSLTPYTIINSKWNVGLKLIKLLQENYVEHSLTWITAIFLDFSAKEKEIKYTQIEMEHKTVFVHMWHDCLYRNFKKKKKLAPEWD